LSPSATPEPDGHDTEHELYCGRRRAAVGVARRYPPRR
jgi:hypothetical protein